MTAENILLTGLPRSGTTLACHLLNLLSNTIALAEPMTVATFSRETVADEVERFAAKQRASLLSRGAAVCKHVDGRSTDNFFGAERNNKGLRQSRDTHGEITFEKTLDPDFMLFIKHPVAFTALLPELSLRFRCYAVIRNPLSVLASWNSTDMKIWDGRSPAAERHDAKLTGKLISLSDRIDRQVALIGWYFEQYERHLSRENVIRYEQMIGSRGKSLAAIAPKAAMLDEVLQSRNSSDAYDWETLTPVYERLIASDGPHWSFYSRGDVHEVYLAAAKSTPGIDQHIAPTHSPTDSDD